MKVVLIDKEWYPVLTPEKSDTWVAKTYHSDALVEIPDEVVERWMKAKAEFEAACEALRPYDK